MKLSIALLMTVALISWVGVVSAQQAPAPAPAPAPATKTPTPPATMAEKMMEGKVKAVDQAKKQVTLEDGTMLTVPPGVQVDWAKVKPGSTVAISYVEAGQKKTVRKFQVKS
jgi:Cu/Ag efflux protein CusF